MHEHTQTRGSVIETPQHYCRKVYIGDDGEARRCLLWPDHAARCGGEDQPTR